MKRNGMTLIELLVGLSIASLVSYIAFDLIRDEQGNYTRTRNKVRLQSDAREAIRVIEEDLANVGFEHGLMTKTASSGEDSVTSFNHARYNQCDTIPMENRVIIKDVTGGGSDTLEARFFRRHQDSGVGCGSTPYRVRYYVDAKHNLIRLFWNAGVANNELRSDSSVVLENVATFQLQAATDTLLYPASTPFNAQTFNYPALHAEDSGSSTSNSIGKWTFAGSAIRGVKTQLTSKKDSAFQILGWSSANEAVVSYLSIPTTQPQSTYQLSCMIRVNPDFQKGFTGTNPASSYLTLSAMLGADTLDRTNITLPTIVNGPTWISWVFQTGDKGGSLKTILRGKLANDPTGSTPIFDLGSFTVRRINGFPDLSLNKRLFWQNGDTATAFRRQISGVRVWLVAKSAKTNNEGDQLTFQGIGNWVQNSTKPLDKNSYAVYERIIPVVHYGY